MSANWPTKKVKERKRKKDERSRKRARRLKRRYEKSGKRVMVRADERI